MTAPIEVDVRALGPLRKIGSGGQGTVYELTEDNAGLVYKEYSPRVVDDVDVAALTRFVEFQRELPEKTGNELTSRAAWPLHVVRRDGVVQGFLMPRAPEEYSVEMALLEDRKKVLSQVQLLLNDESFLRRRDLWIDDQYRLQLILDTARTLALFHELGITVGDLSPNNLLFSRIKPARCFFIDCDAMRLGDDTILDQVETPDWRVADLGDEALATPESDSHKLGLLTIRLFAGDQHSRDPLVVPRRLRRLTVNCLNSDPARRPAVGEWVRPITNQLRTPRVQRRPKPEPAAPVEIQKPPPRQRVNRVPIFVGAAAVIGVLIGIFSSGDPAPPTRTALPTGQFTPGPVITQGPLVGGVPQIPNPITGPRIPPSLLNPRFTPTLSLPLCLLRPAAYSRGVKENTEAVNPVMGYFCAAEEKSLTLAAGVPQDDAFKQRFNQYEANAPYAGITVTGIADLAQLRKRVTVRFTDNTKKCQRSAFTLMPTENGYVVSGVTAPVAATGCG